MISSPSSSASLAGRIDPLHDSEQHLQVGLPAENRPDGRGDVPRREARRGDLVEQGLEEVIVVAVDERDPDRGAGERARGVEAAEAAPDDDNVGCQDALLTSHYTQN